MKNDKRQEIKRNIYICVVISIAIVLAILIGGGQKIVLPELLFWIFIGITTESLIIALTSGVGVSVGVAASIATIIFLGPYQAAICGAISISLRVISVPGKNKRHIFNTVFYKTAFNASQVFISTLCAGYFYELIGGKIRSVTMPQAFFVLPVFIVINYFFICILMSLLLDKKLLSAWISSLKGVFINCLLVGFIGIIMALVAIKIDKYAVLLFFGPLLLARFSYRQYTNLRDTYMETINAFNKALEAKDHYTSGHSLRVQQYSEKLGEAMGLSPKSLNNIKTAAILHDIGKIGIDDFILRKPGRLTKEEFDMIKKHPEIGSDILKDVDFLRDAAKIIHFHHERYDGNGYPDGKKREEIPIESAILSIADVFDAMTSDRPYRTALSREEAIAEIQSNVGIQFNPAAANKFCEIMKEE